MLAPVYTLFHDDKRTRPPVQRLWREAASAATPMPRQVILAAARAAPRGDGHPVLLVPSFLRGDGHMRPLRRFLRARGYAVYGWRLGANVGPTERALDGLERRLAEIVAREGRPASLIGHSLGGAFARELAKQRPEQVRQLIVLASPIRLPTASQLEPLYRMLARWHSPEFLEPLCRAQRAARRPGDRAPHPQRRHRGLGELPRGRGSAPREHRGQGPARHHGAQPRRLARHRRPSRPARRRVAALWHALTSADAHTASTC